TVSNKPAHPGSTGQQPPLAHSGIRPLEEVERAYIEEAIALCGGSVIEAARQLGVSDSTLYRKRARWQDG
ncbi:MAG: sigma-54-dependent Fis family transcriptional regulator, partial [Gammaproteobacteria bacterium]|nr:sigma-54-dependent Fis family transcriptional regulator [Gammaproteobacteria bacterium]